MNFEDEAYIRVYTRKTGTWKRLKFIGRAIFWHLLSEVDRAGLIEVEDDDPVGLVAALAECSREDAYQGLRLCLQEGVIEYNSKTRTLVIPKFIEAQSARRSDKARARAHRQKRRDDARNGVKPPKDPILPMDVTFRDGRVRTPQNSTPRYELFAQENVTPPSRGVTYAITGRDDPVLHSISIAEHSVSNSGAKDLTGQRQPEGRSLHFADTPTPDFTSERISAERYQPSADAIVEATALGLDALELRVCAADLKGKLRGQTHDAAWWDSAFVKFAVSAARRKEQAHASGNGHSTGHSGGARGEAGSASRAVSETRNYDDETYRASRRREAARGGRPYSG